MAGAFVGVLAAAALFGRITRRGWLPTMGAAMPALLLAAALGRFAECLTTEGIGEYMDNPFCSSFPLLYLISTAICAFPSLCGRG